MKFYFYLFFIIFLLYSCENQDTQNNKMIDKNEKKTKSNSNTEKIEEASLENLVTLFFHYAPTTMKNREKNNNITPKINSSIYKVIIDWMVTNKRYVKLKNLSTGEEIIVREGDTTSNIILLERNLFNYKFKINGQIIEVKR